jgi:hypothetical protein
MLIGLIIPGTGGNIEWAIYFGGVSLSLFIVGIVSKKLRRRNAFWISWFILGLILSLEIFGLSANWISKVPIMSMLRVPTRFVFVCGFSMAVINARTFQAIEQVDIRDIRGKSTRMSLISLILFSVLMISGLLITGNWYGFISGWGFGIMAISSTLILLSMAINKRKLLNWSMAALLVFDLSLVSLKFFTTRDIEELVQPNLTVEIISTGRNGDHRVYSPSYAIPQHLAALYDLELADGVDPMQLLAYRSFMEEATGVSGSGYSVSIPEFKTGNPVLDNKSAIPDLSFLSVLNVKYIISHFELDNPHLHYIRFSDGLYHYKNLVSLPRAWIETDNSLNSIPKLDDITPAIILSHKPNSIVIKATGPGTLVLSEVDYPGWSATVDGEAVTIQPAYEILRSVSLEEGTHQINFSYHPTTVYLGIVLAVGFWLNAFLFGTRKML